MRIQKLLVPALATLALFVGTAFLVLRNIGDDSRPPVRVAPDPEERLVVHDLRDTGALARHMKPGVAEQTRSPKSSGAAVARLRILSVGISASVGTGYLTANGQEMIAPSSAYAVAWYQYMPRPGQGGNSVFSGQVDWVGIGPAVFWGLRRVGADDIIDMDLADGTSLKYRGEFSRTYRAGTGPWEELFSPTSGDDVITLYTCDGVFSRGDYSDRRIVRASRFS